MIETRCHMIFAQVILLVPVQTPHDTDGIVNGTISFARSG